MPQGASPKSGPEKDSNGKALNADVDKKVGKMREAESKEMTKGIETLGINIEKEYQKFKQEKDEKKIQEFYTKIEKLADYVPFVRQMQQKMGIDKENDQKFVGVMHQIKNIIQETEMDTHGAIDAFDVVPLEAVQVRRIK